MGTFLKERKIKSLIKGVEKIVEEFSRPDGRPAGLNLQFEIWRLKGIKTNKSELWNRLTYRVLIYIFEVGMKTFFLK